ncbi:hypothetical protein TNCV_3980411 [Trichonephila clavipes]|nr:hypothetical protein TNCV_3980411 [Trichonephila clavipes]
MEEGAKKFYIIKGLKENTTRFQRYKYLKEKNEKLKLSRIYTSNISSDFPLRMSIDNSVVDGIGEYQHPLVYSRYTPLSILSSSSSLAADSLAATTTRCSKLPPQSKDTVLQQHRT